MAGLSQYKDDDERVRRNAPHFTRVPVKWDGVVRGPDLRDIECPAPGAAVEKWKCPPGTIGCDGQGGLKCPGHERRVWCDRAIAWWDDWRRSPQSMVFLDTDWNELLNTAVLVQMLWKPYGKQGAMSLSSLRSAIRISLDQFGATFGDRRRLQMEPETPHTVSQMEQAADEDAEEAVDYAEMLTKAAAKQRKE